MKQRWPEPHSCHPAAFVNRPLWTPCRLPGSPARLPAAPASLQVRVLTFRKAWGGASLLPSHVPRPPCAPRAVPRCRGRACDRCDFRAPQGGASLVHNLTSHTSRGRAGSQSVRQRPGQREAGKEAELEMENTHRPAPEHLLLAMGSLLVRGKGTSSQIHPQISRECKRARTGVHVTCRLLSTCSEGWGPPGLYV